MDRLEMLYNRYGKRKIWLTEFAKCCTTKLSEVEDFMREIIPRFAMHPLFYTDININIQ